MVKTVNKCKAKDPRKCRFHGNADNGVNVITPLLSKPVPDPVFTGPVGAALNSSMNWEGSKPDWWGKYEADAVNNMYAPTVPRLVDVIDSPVGSLAVVWEESSQAAGDKYISLDSGMRVNRCVFKSFETGELLGYVIVTSMDEESFEKSFGDDEFTIFRYFSRYSGHRINSLDNGESRLMEQYPELDDGSPKESDYSVEELRRKVWLGASRALGKNVVEYDSEGNKKYVPSYNLSEKHIPEDSVIVSDLEEYKQTIRSRHHVDADVKYYEVPYVDYSSVKEDLKGSGFGSSLYFYTARLLGEQGKVLRGSGLQSDDAQGVWSRFKERIPGRVGTVNLKYRGKDSPAPVLDFRI